MGTSTSVGKYMNTPKATPAKLPATELVPASASIHSGRMSDAQHADHEHAADEQREDLLHEAPRFPEPRQDVLARQGAPRGRGKQREAQGDGEELAR